MLVEPGQKIAALLGAANRDPAVFDRPDELDVDRDPNPHVAFGVGVHFCLGAPLARMELVESMRRAVRALPGLALAGEPESRGTFVLRGHRSVLVTAARVLRGSQGERSARSPQVRTRPSAAASAQVSSPAHSCTHATGSASTTFGGVPRVWRGPSTHCTALYGGTRSSTWCPGASSASRSARPRTASASAVRPRSPASTAVTAVLTAAGSRRRGGTTSG